MITVNTNLASMLVQKNFKTSTNSLNTAIERLTTGFKINSAKDDATGKGVAIDMDVKLSSNEVAQNNVSMGVSLLNTAEGNVNQMKSLVQRCRDLCVQARNGTYDTDSQNAIKSELTQLVAQANQIKDTAEFNGIELFSGVAAPSGFLAEVVTQNATVVIDEGVSTVDAAKAALNAALGTSGAVIGISNELGLQALAQVVNSGTNCSGKTIVLTDDIDLGSIANWTPIGSSSNTFEGIFNGNGHTISNMTISSSSGYLGLFGCINNGTISNAAVIRASVTGTGTGLRFGGLVGEIDNGSIINSYVSGTVSGRSNVGGLIGSAGHISIINSYATGMVSGNGTIGGLIGITNSVSITNSVAYTSVSATSSFVGGFIGKNSNTTFTNCTYVDNSSGHAVGSITGEVAGITLNTSATPPSSGGGSSSAIILQVGLDGTSNSQISLNLGLDLSALNSILTTPSSASNIATLDSILSSITSVETQIGTGLNRLESVQESLQTQHQTLSSALSVVRDADVSQESARYIRSQILQQASASLLTTANQSPSLLLSLISGMTR